MRAIEGLMRTSQRPHPSNRVTIIMRSLPLMILFPLLTISLLPSNTIFIGALKAGKLQWFARWPHVTLIKTDRNWRRDRNRFDYRNGSCPRESRTRRAFDQLLSRWHCHLYRNDCFGEMSSYLPLPEGFSGCTSLEDPNWLMRKRCHPFCRSRPWIFSWVDILAQVCYCHVYFYPYNYLIHNRPNQ